MTFSPEMTQLGQSDIQISTIALGTWAIGGSMWGGTDARDSIRTILTALNQGINLIDTAPVYGFGQSEELVGKALKEYNDRDHVIVATKAGLEWDKSGKVFRNASRSRIRKEVDDSLRRLQTDYIDLYQIHWPDPVTPHEETAQTLNELVQAGKIRTIGVSNYSPSEMDAFKAVSPIASIQPPYNLFERAIDDTVLPYAHQQNMTVLSYSAICRGLLSGRVTAHREYAGDDLRKYDPKFTEPRVHQYVAAVEELNTFAKTHYQKTVLELALRWVLDRGTVALWGARTPEQLTPVSSVWGWHIAPEHMREIDAIVDRHITDPVGPDYLAPPVRTVV